MNNRRRFLPLLAVSVFTATMGMVAFSNVAGSPRFETYRTLDVIRLMAAGANFGIAFITLVFFFVRPDFRSADQPPAEKRDHAQRE
jgi:hypothetical protein